MAWVVVQQHEQVVTYVDGKQEAVLGPGRHRYRSGRTELVRLDVRPALLTVPGQELLTADGLVVKLSALVRWRIGDPVAFRAGSARPLEPLYAAVQLALRDRVAALSLADAIRDRAALGAGLREEVAAAVDGSGVEVQDAQVKDVMIGAELRRALAETALAAERGRAEVERARGEAAALRALANAARLLEEHPALLHLRTLQVAGGQNATVVLTPPS